MKKLSANYRTDEVIPLPLNIRHRIDEAYLPTLDTLSYNNPKVLVVYSGGNAVGKSMLSKRIHDDLNALVIENDAIKQVILEVFPGIERTDDLNTYTWRYGMELYSRLPELTNNGLVVRDGIIDWYYDRILPIFVKSEYRLFIVQFERPKDETINAIVKRGDLPTASKETLIAQLDDHEIHQMRFRNEFTADVVLTGKNLYDHDSVITRLAAILGELNS